MPRQTVLSVSELNSLKAISENKDDLIRHFTLSDSDLSIIRQRRGESNRLGFAIQLCYMRYPGIVIGVNEKPFFPLLKMVAKQLEIDEQYWDSYGQREQTRRDHISELQVAFGFKLFDNSHYRQLVSTMTETAMGTDKPIVLAAQLIASLREQAIVLSSINVVERICAEAITRANRRIYKALTDNLTDTHRQKLDDLLKIREGSNLTCLVWLRQSPVKPNSLHMLKHIERLKTLQAIELPEGIERSVHQNRLIKIAREGGQMKAGDLTKFEPQRRYATLVALVADATATVIDEIIVLHDSIMGKLFNTAKKKRDQQLQDSGKAINDKLRLFGQIGQALIKAKQSGGDPFAAIESILPWSDFASNVTETQNLAQPEDFSFLHKTGEQYQTLRRYTPVFLEVLKLRAAPAARNVMDAIETLRGMSADDTRKLPKTGLSRRRD
jgi:hypothetical protein